MIMDSGRKISTRLSVKVIIGLVIVSVVTMPSCMEKKSSDVQEKQSQLASVDEERILEIARSHLVREMPDLKQSQLEKSSINFGIWDNLKWISVVFRLLSEPTTTHNKKGEPLISYPTIWVSMDFTGKFIEIEKGPDDVIPYLPGKIEETSETIDKKPQSQLPLPQVSSKESATSKRHVRLVVGIKEMTFEGQKVTWEQLPELLENVSNRSETVLELAVASDEMTVRQMDESRGRAMTLSQQFGFEYLSYVGKHPLGSK